VPRQELTLASASTSTEIHFQSKQFKSSTSTKEIHLDSNKILIRLSSPQRTNFVRIPWIRWKSNSCRVDAFATVAYFIFYHDFGEAIFPNLKGPNLPDELHPLGTLLQGIHTSVALQGVQKAVNNYIAYRMKIFREKVGKGGAISTLFSEFNNLPQFTWNFQTHYACNCNHVSNQNFDSFPLFSIPMGLLNEFSGICTNVIKSTLSSYVGNCSQDYQEVFIEKVIKKIPNYYICTLDYAEDLQKSNKVQPFPQLYIDKEFTLENISFSLAALVYFQQMHYTVYVKGMMHPILQPTKDDRWFYHDGAKSAFHHNSYVQGLLFESGPKLSLNLMEEGMKPYILVYRISTK